MTGRPRRIASLLCGALGVLLIFASFLLGYMTRSLFNERAFADRVAASLENPNFAGYVSEQIADAVIKAKPDLVGLRPVLVGVGRGVVSSPPFRAAVRRSARTLHHAVMSGTSTNLVLSVQDIGMLIESMAETHPALAHKIPPRLTAALGSIQSIPGGELAARLVRLARRMRVATLGLLLVGMALCAAGVWLSGEKRRAIVRTGMALVVLGLVLAIAARFGGYALALLARHAENSPAIVGLAGAFLSGLMLWSAALGFAGLVLAAASASLLERVPLQRWADRLGRWLAGPQPLMRLRLLRGILGTALGAALLIWPLPTLTITVWLAGLVVLFAGLREGFVAALHLMPQIEARAPSLKGAERKPHLAAVALVTGIAMVLLAVTTWVVLRSGASASAPQEIVACNGLAALCDRTLDQVIFPTSHNSMGGADNPGWMFPNQNASIERQLEDGVRGFLIDAHYGVPVGDKVKTELEDEKAAMAKYEAALGKEGMEAVLRIRDRMASAEQGQRDVYMCHGFCELGALKLVPVLKDMREFLVANPGEVLIIVIQDESVTPKDIEHCFEESGLVDFVYRGPAKPPWPTLREMVESDQRVLVMAENHSEGVAWYHAAFEVVQETPYEFHDPSEFSNRPNRGGTGGSLYQMNHWIETTPMPKPSNAAIVNAHDALLARIRAFRRERGHYPNLVAVDFYGTGDLVQVVRELNEQPLARGRGAPPGP
jgi:hypothetical protein